MIYILETLNIKVSFMFIPSHIGINGNEEIDQQAKSATVPSPFNLTSVKDIKILLDNIELENWQNLWSQKIQNKLFQHKKTIKPWKHLSHLNRSEEIIITRLRIGHTKLTHNYLFLKTPKPNCQFCNTEEITVKHLLFHCTNLKTIRLKQNIPENSETIPDEPSQISKILYLIKELKLTNQI